MRRFVHLRDIRIVPICLCTDCKLRISSSMVLNVAPRLPLHPIFEGKLIQLSYPLFRSPNGPDRDNASKVSVSVFTCSTDVCRDKFDAAMLTPGPMDPMEMFGVVSGWLHNAGTSVVSGFTLSRLIDAYALDLQSSVFVPMLPWHPGLNSKLTNHSNLFSRSLHCPHHINVSQVSISDLLHSTDICRSEFDVATSMAGSMDSMETF